MHQILRNAMATAAIGSIVALAGCGGFGGGGGGSSGSTVPPVVTKTPTTIAKASGDGQSALVSTAIPSPIVVVVTASDGSPVAGVNVTFAVATGGGSLSATNVSTDSAGLARTTLTVGATAGANTVTASASGSSGNALAGSPLTFTETGTSTPPPPPPPSGPTFVADLLPLMQSANCLSCHTPGQGAYSGADLSTYAALTTGTSKFGYSPAAYVTAGNPSASLLLTVCSGSTQGSQMPLGGTALTATQLATISTWIANGAPYSSSGSAATQIQKTSGDGQSATAGGMLAAPFVVTVLDSTSKPVSGVTVTWAITAGNGTLSATSTTSDASGQAKTTLTTGMTAGTNTVTASSSGLSGSPISFSATGNPGPAAKLAYASGNNQSMTVGSKLAPFVVKITDSAGNAVSGTTVNWAIATGTGSLSGSSSASDATGSAAITLTLPATPGTTTVTASSGTLSGSPFTFTATATTGTASSLAIVSGDAQTGVAGTALSAKPLTVVVKDAAGNPVSGFTVNFAISMGAGKLSASSAPTNASGMASTVLTLDTVAGTNKVTASGTGLTAVTFTETGTAGPATSLAKLSGDGQTAVVGTMLPNALVVVAKDTNGNLVSGQAVTFTVTTGGGALSQVMSPTGTNGQASAKYTLGATAGSNTVTATAGSLTAVFTETGTSASAPTMTMVSGNNQTGVVGANLANPFIVVIKDSTGKPVAGQAVTIAVASGVGSLSSMSTTTNSMGQASALLKLGTTAGTNNNTVTFTATGVTGSPQTFTASAMAGPAAKLVKSSGDAQTGTVGMALAMPLVTQVQDSFGNAVQGVAVSFSTTAGTLSAMSGTSDSMGNISITLTLGTAAGSETVTASRSGLTSVMFTETAKAGAPATVAISSGNNQTAAAGTLLPNALVVLVTDSHANAVAGVSVTFAVTAGGGSLSTTNATTSTSGLASAMLTLGATAGTNTVTATVTGLTAVTFTETGTTTSTPRYYTTDIQPLFATYCLTACHQAGGSQANHPLDTYTAVVNGTSTTYTPAAYIDTVGHNPANSLIYLKCSTATKGPQMPLTGGPLSAAQLQVIFDWISQGAKQSGAGAPASITKTAGDTQSGPAGSTLPTALTVVVKDASSNPVPSVTVTFAVATGGGSLSATSVATDSTGTAKTMLTLGAAAGSNTVTATVSGLSAVTFTETGTASSYSGAPLTGSTNPIDVSALAVLKAANVEPAPLSSDNEFVRRVYADLSGRLPTENETMTFVNDTTANKRATLIDALLAGAEFPKHWGNDIFTAWACVHTNSLAAITAFKAAATSQINADTPLSTMATDLITGGGPTTTILNSSGVALTMGQIWESTFLTYGNTAQMDQFMLMFAGMTSECARCHDHHLTVAGQDNPMWTQNDNYGLYAYVAATSGSATEVDISGKPFGKPITAHFVADGYANTVSSTTAGQPMSVANTPEPTRRATFAGIFTNSNAFARGTSHRIFAEVMNPLLDPNQFLAANLAAMSEPGLLNTLTAQFKAGGYSLKSFLRLILNSKLYQLTTDATKTGTTNDAILARRTVRRHHSEVLEAGIFTVATGPTTTPTLPNPVTAFEQQFGYPINLQTLLDRTDAVNIGQGFMLLNSQTGMNGSAKMTGNQITPLANQVVAGTMTFNAAVTRLYHFALSRDPSATELSSINSIEASLLVTPLTAANVTTALADVAVALTSSSEFASR